MLVTFLQLIMLFRVPMTWTGVRPTAPDLTGSTTISACGLPSERLEVTVTTPGFWYISSLTWPAAS